MGIQPMPVQTTPEYIETYVEMIINKVEIGYVRSAVGNFKRYGDLIEKHGTDQQRQILSEARSRLESAIQHERIHGEYSLMKWDHPKTIELLELFRPHGDLIELNRVWAIRAKLDSPDLPRL
jgi:hypothetical protein